MTFATALVLSGSTYRILLPALFMLGLLGISFVPRVAGIPILASSFHAAFALLAIWYAALLWRSRLRRRLLEVEFNVVRTHYVQAIVQSSIYLYWATAWPFIAGQFVLIAGQWCFAYACTLLVAWTRREKAEFGFGPLPIILSTNFFLCFRDEWFYMQFVMITVGVFGKEFLRWQRDGRNTHIFNPSVFGLSIFSLAILLTGATDLTWAQQFAIELGRPEHIYLWIFVVGLIVQYLFQVTLVTFAAAAALWLLNLAYTQATGIFWFLDAGIPIAVFLGLHLLVTDPATSPRNNFGRAIFGAMYGGGVFLLYGLLEWAGVPRFYDKLLFVPVLNLLVPVIDRYARGSRLVAVSPFFWIGSLTSKRQNLLFMVLWIAAFTAMYKTNFLGPAHPGRAVEFWEAACAEGKHNACHRLSDIHRDNCSAGNTQACFALADMDGASHASSANRLVGALALARACDVGDQEGCHLFADRLIRSDAKMLQARCDMRDGESCYALGTASLMGLGLVASREAALGYFSSACDLRWASACGNLAEMYRHGVGTQVDERKAVVLYERACALGYAAACVQLGGLFATGDHVQRDEVRAIELLRRSCRLGLDEACGRQRP